MSSSVAGAEISTRPAPAARCFSASARLVNSPVHSSATSTPSLAQGRFAGSRSANTRMASPFTLKPVLVTLIRASKRPWLESYSSRWAFTSGEPRSLIATTRTSSRPDS